MACIPTESFMLFLFLFLLRTKVLFLFLILVPWHMESCIYFLLQVSMLISILPPIETSFNLGCILQRSQYFELTSVNTRFAFVQNLNYSNHVD